MGIQIINPWGARQPFLWYAQINQICFQKVNKYKKNFVILQAIGIIEIKK